MNRRGCRAAAVAAVAGACAGAGAQSCLWMQAADQIPFDLSARLVYDPVHERVLLFRSTAAVGEVWSWQGATWALLASNGPRRPNAGVAYDSARQRLVLFGGQPGGYARETWEWDGGAWALRSNAGPSPRWAWLAYDAARDRTVLFGGWNGASLSDTWEWDGQSWTLRSTAGPGALDGPIAYDSVRHRTVLLGSTLAAPNPQLWEWDGATWTHRPTDPTAGPTEGGVLWMVFDPSRGRMIVEQARVSNVTFPGTWELEMATAQWELRAPGVSLYGPAAFDTVRGVAVAQMDRATWRYDPGAPLVPAYIAGDPVGGSFEVGATVVLRVDAGGTDLRFQWLRAGMPLANGGNISGADTGTLRIGPAARADTGSYSVDVWNDCAYRRSQAAFVQVGPVPCYANCDESTTEPFLNVLDFYCFMRRFAAGDSWADCDHSNPPPWLNVLDFNCFLNVFAAGCSSP